MGLLPSRRLGADDKLSHPRDARKWLDSLADTRPLEACDEVSATVNASLKHFSRLDAERAAALVLVDKWAGPHRIALLDEYTAGARTDAERERRIWETLTALQQALGAAYDALLQALREAPPDRGWRARLPMLVTRRLAHTRHDALLRSFRYERWIPRRWRQVHELYQWVREQDIHHKPATTSGRRGNTPESEYIRVLLTQQLNQGCFAPRDTMRIQRWLGGWSGSLRLSRQARSARALAVDLTGQAGLQVRPHASAPGLLWLDMTPLLDKAAAEIDAGRRDRETGDEGTTQSLDERVALLQQLTALWLGQAPQEQGAFQGEGGERMRAVFGLVEVERAVRHEARARRAADGSAPPLIEVIEIVEVGDAGSAPAESADWLVADRTPTSCRMRGMPPADALIAPGTLTGLRDPLARRWSIGVVRRMQRAPGNEVELSLQLIALDARRLTLADPVFHTQVSDETVEGATEVMRQPGRCGALFLPPGEAPPALPGRSIIVGRKHYQAGKTYWCRIGRNHYSLSLKRALERTADYVWAAIEVDKQA